MNTIAFSPQKSIRRQVMTIYTYNLDAFQIEPDAPIYRYPFPELNKVSEDDPAVSVMTDLKYVSMITIEPDDTFDTALQIMIHAGARLLVVLASDNSLQGLITGRDIMGGKAVKLDHKGKYPTGRDPGKGYHDSPIGSQSP
jgi:hypothetical protein